MERHGVLLVELSSGDFFGESALLNSKPSTANYIAQTFCDVFTLSRHNFEQVIEYYPRYRQLLIWKMSAINAQKRKQVALIASGGQGKPAEAAVTKEAPPMPAAHTSPTMRPHEDSPSQAPMPSSRTQSAASTAL